MKQTIFLSTLLYLFFFLTTVVSTDIDTVRTNRIAGIIFAATGASSIPTWLSTLDSNGKWPDSQINYATGCNAQEASWPAQSHWSRINTFAAAWHGGFKNAAQWAGDAQLRTAISNAMNFWFSQDFPIPACIDSGGTAACPCSTPGFWNTNWSGNIVLIPTWVGQVCLLLGDSLTASERSGCSTITGRAYATFQTGINGVKAITGANTLDIASIGIDLGLSTSNMTLVLDAYAKVHSELSIKDGIKADGIRADGSFGQHSGIIYNGNYGKDYANDILALELAADDTEFQATSTSKAAFTTLLDANQWMIFRNVLTGVLHWDFSVLGRIIGLPVSLNQPTANLRMNLTQIQVLGQKWNSPAISQIFDNLALNTTDANAGALEGNRMFYANDYMVQRGKGYVTTLRMYSTRTQNTECTISQNPFGFHLADGTLYTYLQGNEYEDIFASWDWNLIPGITVDYNATPLTCDTVRKTGTQSFVGGASDGSIGVAAMHYQTPTTKTLSWRKTWFFLEDDVQFVMVAKLTSTTSAPVFTVLDQRRHSGDVFMNGVAASSGNFTSVDSLWHGGVGYSFDASNTNALSLQLGERTGSWQAIGTSPQPPTTVDLFAAWLNHTDLTASVSYAIYPATTLTSFQQKTQASNIEVIRNDGSISALLDIAHHTAMLVYWDDAGGSVDLPSTTGIASMTITSTGNAAVIAHTDTWVVTVSDPTQTLTTLTLNFTFGAGPIPPDWVMSRSKVWTLNLPTGGFAGSSVTQSLV